jgi:formiminoglutamase
VLPPTSPDDLRLGHLIGRDLAPHDAPRVVIAGFPTDVGVRRNGGRPGAAAGPAAIRAALHKLTPDAERPAPFVDLLARTRDLGDLEVSDDLEADQRALGDALAPHLAAGAFVVVLGGGHETAYGHFLAHVALGAPVRLLNWDAHADVRPLRDGRAHSGSPFRQALEHPGGLAERYVVAGLQPHSAAAAHVEYVRARGAVHFRRALDDVALVDALYAESPTIVSFDLDALGRAHAPGVSAPAVDGIPIEAWLRAAYLAGRTPSVRAVDVVELSPPHDVDGATAATAALTVWHVLRGLAHRDA